MPSFIIDERRPPDVPDRRPFWIQFKEWRERDWYILGYPPERPSPYWFALATDFCWMTLNYMERMTKALEQLQAAQLPASAPAEEPPPEP